MAFPDLSWPTPMRGKNTETEEHKISFVIGSHPVAQAGVTHDVAHCNLILAILLPQSST